MAMRCERRLMWLILHRCHLGWGWAKSLMRATVASIRAISTSCVRALDMRTCDEWQTETHTWRSPTQPWGANIRWVRAIRRCRVVDPRSWFSCRVEKASWNVSLVNECVLLTHAQIYKLPYSSPALQHQPASSWSQQILFIRIDLSGPKLAIASARPMRINNDVARVTAILGAILLAYYNEDVYKVSDRRQASST